MKRKHYSFIGFIIGGLFLVRAGEYLIDYIWGDKNGQITSIGLASGFAIIYDILLVTFVVWCFGVFLAFLPDKYKSFPQQINPTLCCLILAVCSHAVICYIYPPAGGPDYLLYPGSALELFQNPLRNPYILMDRNGYYPYLIWLFLQLPGQLATLVYFQHLVSIGLTCWMVRMIERLFGKGAALMSGIALTFYLPLLLVPHITNSEAANLLALWPTALCAMSLALNWHQQKQIRAFLLIGFGVSSGLSILARPSGVFLVFPLLILLWCVHIPRRSFVVIFISMAIIMGPVFLYNYIRLDYIGIEKKSGRILFQVAWFVDKTYSSDNGPASLQVATLLRDEWERLLKDNPVVREQQESIDDLLADPEELPEDLYYLIVNLARREYPPKQADQLLKDAAMEAIRKHFKQFVFKRLDKFRVNLFESPRLQLDFTLSQDLQRKEDKRFAAEPKYRYRATSVLYHDESYLQTPEQIQAFLVDWGKIQGMSQTRSPLGLKLAQWWWKMLSWIRYIDIYSMIGTCLFCIWKFPNYVLIPTFRRNILVLFGAMVFYNILNRVFVYGISAGLRFHLLPSLPFELVMGILGILGISYGLKHFPRMEKMSTHS